ncbi:hypothetical protein EL22_14000 [Halostagnicola sp. A56]|nr:hypothetical protein [Halostagnicola sp. A56]KDE57237.1 hypothetical protein EL22_14000 [Halostagnicola sp. A56]
MTPTNQTCPICGTAFEKETRLTIHLEVEHRKSELATKLVAEQGDSSVPVADPETENDDSEEGADESRSNTRLTPPM